MDYRKYIDMDPVNYSDEELKNLMNMLEFEYGKIVDSYAEEIKAISTPNFDPYSFRGEKKISKIAKKYSEPAGDIGYLMDIIEDEMKKRGKFYEEQRYREGGAENLKPAISEEEFLEKESLKTLKHKQDIDSGGLV